MTIHAKIYAVDKKGNIVKDPLVDLAGESFSESSLRAIEFSDLPQVGSEVSICSMNDDKKIVESATYKIVKVLHSIEIEPDRLYYPTKVISKNMLICPTLYVNKTSKK